MIDRATVDKILDATQIVDVIGDFVSLRRRGANYLGLCPFHQDKNPSMSVSPTKGIFKCFSCGKSGTALSFLMEHEHLSYPDALKYLAAKYGIEVQEEEESPEQIAQRLKYESLAIVSQYAGEYYQDYLFNSEHGKAIGLAYFKERGFSELTIKKFGLGFSPIGRSTFVDAAKAKSYKEDIIVDAGLAIRRDNGEVVDRFYDRVMFPIHNISGKIIAFGGRTLRTDKSVAKYINSPETELYNKSRSLYGIFFAKSAISKEDKCYLVEGYTDVLSMHQAGIENVVASSGTALTVEQIRLIKRFTNKITIIYDGDEAGIKASLRGIDLILEQGMEVKVVLLPENEDPDSFSKSRFKDQILSYIEANEKDFISYKSDLLLKDSGRDPIKRANVINDVIASIAVIPDAIVRNVYVEEISQMFDLKSESIFTKISSLRDKRKNWNRVQEQYQPIESPQEAVEPVNKNQNQQSVDNGLITNGLLAVSEREILYYLLKFGLYTLIFEEDRLYNAQVQEKITVAHYIKSELDEDELEFVNPIYKSIYDLYYSNTSLKVFDNEKERDFAQQRVMRFFMDNNSPTISQSVLKILSAEEDESALTIDKYKDSLVPEEHKLSRSVPKSVLLYKLRITEQHCMQLTKKLGEIRLEGNPQLQITILSQLQQLTKVKNAFSKELSRL